MSRKHLQTLVTCDKCGLNLAVYVWSIPFPGDLNAYLKHKGWEVCGEDLCPDCYLAQDSSPSNLGSK